MSQKEEDTAVSNFREYIRVKTVHPDPDYDGCMEYLKGQALSLNLPYKILELVKGKPIFLMTWEGQEPELSAILLNSHTDVVPVFPEHWCYDPFEAKKDEHGNIYGRGTQDMKCVGIQYLEAIRRLKKDGKSFKRTIHLSFVPDEEIGGLTGMGELIKTEDFKKMNIGYALDEGLANPTEAFSLFYGERCTWWVWVKCTGDPGHGSRFIENTAAEKLWKVINSFMEYRDAQKEKLKYNPDWTLGDVTSLNMTILRGGVQENVVPAELEACFDVRICPTTKLQDFEAMIKKWCKEAGDGVSITFSQKGTCQALTSTSKEDPWWNAFSSACEDLKLKLSYEIFPAGTDSRMLRENGIPAIGFSPINNTPILLHDHNEYLNEDMFLRGIDIYCKIIPALAEVSAF